MKKLLVAALLWAVSATVMASCQITDSDLTDQQVQQFKVQCEQMKLEAQKVTGAAPVEAVKSITKEDLTEWAKISQEFAKAIGMAAHELGVSVNEFLVTPAGILTAAILIWKIIGSSILGGAIGILFTVVIYKLNRRFWFHQMEPVERKTWFRGTKVVEIARYHDWRSMPDAAIGWSIFTVILLGIYWMVVLCKS